MTPLAPNDAELVEADARRIYEHWVATDWRGEAPAEPWETAPDLIRKICLAAAANPYCLFSQGRS